MKTFLKLTFAIAAIAIIFSSCSKSNDEGKMIPKNAVFVAQIDTKSMSAKLSWDEVKQTSWYKKVYSDPSTPDWRKKILDNPSASGIDFDKGLTFFMSKGAGTNFNIVVEGVVKSGQDFEQFNKNFDPAQAVRKAGDVSLITLKDKNVVGWNGNRFAYVMNSATTSSEMYKWNGANNPSADSSTEDNSADLSDFCAKLFSLKSDSSLEKNKVFADLLKEEGDIHFFQNIEATMNSLPAMGMLGMMKLDAFFKDNFSTGTVSFDKGKIDVHQKQYVSKELTDVLKKYLGGKINTDMIKNIPSQDVIALFAGNFKPEGIVELIKLTGADGLLNTYAQQMGFTLEDFSKAGNGDVMFAVTDLKMKANATAGKDSLENKPGMKFSRDFDFNYIFSAGIGDKASLQKIINAGKKAGSQMGKDSLFDEHMNDKTFAVSNTDAFAQKYLAGGSSKYDFTDKINGHPVGIFIDFHKMFSAMATEAGNKPDSKAMMDQNLKTWNTLYMTGGDYKDGAFTANTEINMVDQNTNSLKQLNSYMDQMYQLEETRKANSGEKKLDSLLTPPPIDTVKVK